jgi:Fe-S oxidoreductase
MEPALISPANAMLLGLPARVVFILIPLVGVGIFAYIIFRRLVPLQGAVSDTRFDRVGERLSSVFKYWLGQLRHPRYMLPGVMHILLFSGFLILSIRSLTLVFIGIVDGFVLPGLGGGLGEVYAVLKDVAASFVLVAVIVLMIRRGIFKPARYAVPARYGKEHTAEAIFVLCLITGLVVCDMIFEGSLAAAEHAGGGHAAYILPLTGTWVAAQVFTGLPVDSLQGLHVGAYFLHEIIFFFFLCFLPLGKHFHVITSLFNVYFMKLDKGTVKPVRWGVPDEKLDDLESFGVKVYEDFTWKHVLDFYSCVDCGRCSDNCPANAAGRPLSPRFISIKCRDHGYKKYPLLGNSSVASDAPLIGKVLEEDEIWSCTTCGACEEECPVLIEYIDKIVDLRRAMVEEGMVPQSLQKPLRALEKRGNPWGKMERKRADWAAGEEFSQQWPVKVLGRKESAETLYFVDSISSFDDRMQDLARSTAQILTAAGIDFGILGKAEKDSGHEARRFGEEMLFQDLRDQNTDAILNAGVAQIVTADPHAFNALKNDYQELPPVRHITQVILDAVTSGRIEFNAVEDIAKTYTYHDPCYLGRHNGLYEPPRQVLDAIPDLKRIDMSRCRDRSFCCGGGGLMLFYEPEEEQRMGVIRVQMAKEAGADVIVTACPFCLVNIEDAIKVAGLDKEMEAIDLVELVSRQMKVETGNLKLET